jgi:hypothetical protein
MQFLRDSRSLGQSFLEPKVEEARYLVHSQPINRQNYEPTEQQ